VLMFVCVYGCCGSMLGRARPVANERPVGRGRLRATYYIPYATTTNYDESRVEVAGSGPRIVGGHITTNLSGGASESELRSGLM
jgi:hypothetical protein